MKKKILLLIMVVFFFIGWNADPRFNTPVCTAGNDQKKPQLAADGEGGAVIVWEDARAGGEYDIYAQRIDASGAVKWPADGIAVCAANGPQRYPRIAIAAGNGNPGEFIVTWYDRRNGKDYDIYAQRVDPSGTIRWAADGVVVCAAKEDQYDPFLVPDGGGGAIIVWYDRRSGNHYDIYAQRIDSSGRLQWSPDGTIICNAEQDQDNPQAVPGNKGGAVILWQDRRNGNDYDIYAQLIDPYGRVQWTANGVPVCAAGNDQRNPHLVSTGTGAVITWQDKRSGNDYDIYAQRIDFSGAAQWTANGVPVCTAANSQYDPRLAPDGKGGAIVTWQDYRGGAECNFDAFAQQTDLKSEICQEKQLHDWNIYAQRIDAAGKIQWAANGVAICLGKADQYKPQPVPDGSGGVIVTWRAADKENDHNIYAQRLNSSGLSGWSAYGVAVSTAGGNQYDPLPLSDGSGGALVAWYDKRKGNQCDIYVQKICPSGKIGNCPMPVAMNSTNR